MKRTSKYLAAFFLLALTATAAFAQSDPGLNGPYAVTRAEYNYGETTLSFSDFPGPVEFKASVHYPSNIASQSRRFPLIIFLHGRHSTCYAADLTPLLKHPCGSDTIIPSYKGYDYAGQQLASHGFIVVSISANGINAKDNQTDDGGALGRARLIREHLYKWRAFNNTGAAPFGNTFRNKVDFFNVGTMGHSRGGEGVVRHFLLNEEAGDPFFIKAVFPLAPTDFNRNVANFVAVGVMLPYCDGDVFDLQGVHYYDDARYNEEDDFAPKYSFLDLGANHNFYNTIWTPGLFPAGTFDDWSDGINPDDPHCGSPAPGKRLTASQQRAAARAYFAAFFRVHLKRENQFSPYLIAAANPPASAQTANIFPSYHAPLNYVNRLDVNRLLEADDLEENELEGDVSQSNLIDFSLCGGESPQPLACTSQNIPLVAFYGFTLSEPHIAFSGTGLSQLRLNWFNDGTTKQFRNDFPYPLDVTKFQSFQFRAQQNYEGVGPAVNPVGQSQDFSVVLTDFLNRSATVRVGSQSRALYYPPGDTPGIADPPGIEIVIVPRIVLNTIRLPLSAFSGVDLRRVKSVRFVFDRKPQGSLLVSDIAFASPPK